MAIVTGAGNGIGKATALLFAREGAAVVVADIEQDAGNETMNQVRASGGRAIFVKIDVSNKSEAENMVNMALREFGKLDIEANIAGITGRINFMEITEEKLSRMLDVHVKGTFYCVQAAAKHMMERRYGKIINTTSGSGITGQANNAHYSGAKAGIIGITMAAAKALAPYEINVNAISPVGVTRMTRDYPEVQATLNQPSRLRGRVGMPEDVAPAYLFLASDEAAYITGNIIHATGGRHLGI